MTTEELIAYCKLLLRQKSTTSFDDEIKNLISACLLDLDISGVMPIEDDLVKRAVGTYVKAHFGSENPDRDGLIECYNSLKTHLSISRKYGQVLPNEEISNDQAY